MVEELWVDDEFDTIDRVIRLFHLAYDAAPEVVQKKVAKGFVSVVREEAGARAQVHEDHFFRGSFLEHLTEPERKLVKDHLFARMKCGHLTSAQLASVEGLSAYIKASELNDLVDPFVRTVAYAKAEQLRDEAASRLEDEHWSLPSQLDDGFVQRLDAWVEFLVEKERTEAADRIASLRGSIRPADEDLPF